MYLKINQIFVCLRGMWENKKKIVHINPYLLYIILFV